jgi:uncharacterized RDD family membrane protein YckC
MRTIDITTTQKVTIQYELASLRERIFAYSLDFIFVIIFISILRLIFLGAFGLDNDAFFQYFITIPTALLYTLLMEFFNNGQTLGKAVMGIKVVKLDGKAPGFSDYLTRVAFRSLDIYMSFGSIAALLVSSSSKAQRLGDINANTTLIKVRFNLRFKLDDIERISTLDEYEPLYPQVRQLNESDMLLIKTVINRVQKYPNKAHKTVLDSLVDDLRKKLDIFEKPKNKIDFLKVLIKDYIVLTR